MIQAAILLGIACPAFWAWGFHCGITAQHREEAPQPSMDDITGQV